MEYLGTRSSTPELLALRTLKLGDLLVAVPALHGLRRGFPDHRIILAVPGWLEPIVELIDGVDALLPTAGLNQPLAIEPGRIDVAVNLHGSGPESDDRIDELQARLVLGHRRSGYDGPEWVDGINERVRWARLIDEHGIPADPTDLALRDPGPQLHPGAVVVHPGAFYASRHWPIARFAAVVRALTHKGFDVVLTGSEAERERALAVAHEAGLSPDAVLAGRIGLGEFAAIVAHARLVISADTGAAHLASAYATPSVVLFGPAPVEEWGPPPGPHTVLTDASLRRGDTFGSEPDPALLAVTVDDVLAASWALLD